ncbi:Ribosomal protein S16 domain [Phytophthora cactorum]|nr:Ribosomal protein S16 domain [Phytophthora cactorum]
MVVRLRLARWGRKDLPFYRIVAADARAPRDGKHLEIVRLRCVIFRYFFIATKSNKVSDDCQPFAACHFLQLGTFNPIAASDGVKELRVNSQRVRYWMSVGAQPSDRVAHLLGLANVLPMPPTRQYTKKNVPKKDRE